MLFNTLISFTLLAPLALGESLEAYRYEKRSTLQTRQSECLPGATTCSSDSLFRYCANPGYKCCNAQNIAPVAATCCPNGYYAQPGYYCCSDGRSCQNGRTCRGCTPVGGSGGVPPVSSFAVPSSVIPAPTSIVPVPSSRVVPVNTYYTFTITYYYFQYYYTYVQALSRSSPTSSTVTTTTTVSVFAANSAEARESFSTLSATVALPTPASATFLPPLPEQTASNVFPALTSTVRGGPTATNGAASSTSQSFGAAVRATGEVGKGAWRNAIAGGVIGIVGLGLGL